MTSKLQQVKNEKLLKELARLPDNKRCAICTNMGTQYTCQPPNIFVCSACAGVLYHFPGFRVKSRSMGTYTTQEVQQMKEGGNAMFIKHYLAKWNSSTFPPPVDKNPKRTEEFIKQVLVDKVFYSEEPVSKDNNNKEALSVKPRAVLSTVGSGSFKKQTTFPQTTPAQSPWEAFPAAKSAEINTSNSGQSTMTGTSGGGGNWAEFTNQTTTNVSTNTSAFDPFGTTGPDLTSPVSAQLTPPQSQESLWDPFQDKAAVQNQPQSAPVPVGWSSFETSSIAKDPATVNNVMKSTPESGNLDAQQSTMISANDGTRQKSTTPKSPALDPLPEEWFSVGNSAVASGPFGDPRTGVQGTVSQHQSYMMPPANHQQMQYPVFGARQNFQNPQSSAFSYGHPHMSPPPPPPPPSLGAFPSFRSTTTGQPPSGQSWNTASNPYTLQSQDSMQSYVSARVDDSAHHPLFQNLDMDMRAKAHSVAGVPIQTRGVFRNGPIPGNSNFARPDSTSAEIQHSFMQQQRNFEEASGNPFA